MGRPRLAVALVSSYAFASSAAAPALGEVDASAPLWPQGSIVGALLLLATVDLICFAGQRPQPPSRKPAPTRAAAAKQEAYGACVAALVLAVDGATAAITVPLLPSLSHGHGPAALYFARPVVGAACLAVLPLMMRPGLRSGAVATAAGLVALAASCLMYASASSFWLALGARLLGAAGSASAVTGVFCSMILRAPSEHTGWRGCLAVFGAAVGCAVGPFAGRALHDVCGQQDTMVVLALAVAAALWLHLSEARSSTEASRPEIGTQGSIFKATKAALRDDKRRALLVGLTLSSAVMALHTTLTPLTLEQAAGDWFGSAGATMFAQLAAGLVFAVAALGAGAVADATGEQWAAGGAVVALVLNILGLRCLDWAASGRPMATTPAAVLALLGLCSSHVGLGAYVGFALPMFLRRTRSPSQCDAGPRVPVTAAPSPAAAAVAAAFLGAAFLLGDALGAGAQFLLVPLVGPRLTACAFAFCLAAHAVAVLAIPNWVRGSGAVRLWRSAAQKKHQRLGLTSDEWKAAAAMTLDQ